MQIIDGRKISRDILAEIKKEVANLPFVPIFCDIMVGDDKVSRQYVSLKARVAESIGIKFQEADFKEDITTEGLISEIGEINKVENMCGVIVQLPLPAHLDKEAVLDSIDSRLDVDGLGSKTSEKFYAGEPSLSLPTAQSCITLLDSTSVDFKDKEVVVLGRGPLVGRPVAQMLRLRGVEPVIVSSQTEEKEKIIKEADIIISGIGQGKFIKGEMVKPGVIIIDAGTSEEGNSVVGDVDLESVSSVAGWVSPVPGGVGPMTIAMLLSNVLKVAKQKANG